MEKIKFNNGKLRILQISDAQDLHWVRKSMLQMLNKACDTLKPDLIVFTGDNILGNHLRDYRFSSKKKDMSREEEFDILRTALNHVLEIPEKRKIPFAVIYGNHDDMNSFTGDEQADIIRSYSMNRGFENTGELCGTYRLPVYSSDGENQLLNLWMINTSRHDKKEDKCYNEINKTQVEWFRTESEAQKNANNGKAFPSIMFMHIPLNEVKSFVQECSEEESTIQLPGFNARRADGVFGHVHEPVCALEEENGFYDAILEDGGIMSVVNGHDHLNDFEGKKDGIRFISVPTASFRCYGNPHRGVKLFELSEKNPADFYTRTYYYKELCGDNIISDFRLFWDADEYEKKKFTVLGAAGVACVVAGAGTLIKKFVCKK